MAKGPQRKRGMSASERAAMQQRYAELRGRIAWQRLSRLQTTFRKMCDRLPSVERASMKAVAELEKPSPNLRFVENAEFLLREYIEDANAEVVGWEKLRKIVEKTSLTPDKKTRILEIIADQKEIFQSSMKGMQRVLHTINERKRAKGMG